MATLYIEEYQSVGVQAGIGMIPVPTTLLAKQKVTIDVTQNTSSALNAATRFVLLTTDTACQFEVNANANGDSRFLPADASRFIGVSGKGGSTTISVITQQ